jgi:ABC-2 type transport system permease protein
MVMKEFRELRRDRRTMAMIVFLPILLLVVFGYAANFEVADVTTAVLGPQADQAAANVLPTFDVVETDPDGTEQTATDLLQRNTADVAVLTGTQPTQVYVDGSALFSAQAAVSALNRLGDQVQVEILFNPDLKTSWVMVPGIVGLILMFVGTVVTSIGLVKERERGTLEQLAVMPIKPSTVILGKISPYFLLASLDMILVTVLGMLLFDVPFNGNVAAFALGAALFLFVVLGIGVFISTVSATVGQAIQTAFFFLLPQILLSGFIFPLDAIPWGVRWISYLLPLTYFTQISQGIMLRGAPIDSLWLPFLALTVMAVFVFAGAVLRFRRSLTPGKPRRHRHAKVAA